MPVRQPRPPHPGDLIKTVRSLAGQGRVTYTAHAAGERMRERGIEVDDVLKVLRRGDILGDVTPGRRANGDAWWSAHLNGRDERPELRPSWYEKTD